MSADKLRLVRDYAELRTGMLVVVKCDLPGCGKTHRGMLGDDEFQPLEDRDGVEFHGYARGLLPPGIHSSGSELGITASTVARRIVYRVEDGLELSNEHRRSEVVR